jgi:hypothetical protein
MQWDCTFYAVHSLLDADFPGNADLNVSADLSGETFRRWVRTYPGRGGSRPNRVRTYAGDTVFQER